MCMLAVYSYFGKALAETLLILSTSVMCVHKLQTYPHEYYTCIDPCASSGHFSIGSRPPYNLFILSLYGYSSCIQQSSFYFIYLFTDLIITDISILSSAWWVGLITTIFSRGGQSCCHNDNPVINRIMMPKLQPTLSHKPGTSMCWPIHCVIRGGDY